ncbi:Ferrichrome transport system permease protein FhuB [Salinisphaera shabanensis E1L3A]|uniref:Ferrichrome transport system permease protein FhuB n=1 Tax=Salinisphaera shabanensis E1L3A TaxID=1033802 RepID=U2G034_9GAMM|nr:Fe(3+)-hydroxamate ABC transporter permease FhuB [Salinisphaera shabanensis]ERJ19688.1 Ferrichrome transport system permease protein FhuB [Salinisphaera shabanensis E1L3A]
MITPWVTPARLCGGFALLLAVLAAFVLHENSAAGIAALWADSNDIAGVLARYNWLPRVTAALVGGAGLALAGVLFQQTLRNPLAAPTTLGVVGGVHLALLVGTLFAPALMVHARGLVGFAGGAGAMALVFALAWRRNLAPTVVVLAGLVVNLYFGALAVVLLLFNEEALRGMMIWGAGSLAQNNWDGVLYLLPRLALAGVAAVALSRALALLDLDDTNAKNLGISLAWLRAASLGLGVFASSVVIVELGIVGFIGLAAPSIVRLAGARRLASRLIWAPIFGGLLLAVTDQVLELVTLHSSMLIPTGATTAALGAPLLLWLIPRLNLAREPGSPPTPAPRSETPGRLVAMLAIALVAAVIVALLVGQGADGWDWPFTRPWDETGLWRVPRVLAAGAAGAMLAVAGTVIQRVSGNAMASPEVLGISAGTGLGVLAVVLLMPGAGVPVLLLAGMLGALASLAVLVGLNARSDYEPERVLLTGISVLFLFDAVAKIVLAGGDPRTQQLLAWMSGTTYYVELPLALTVAVLGVLLFAVIRPLQVWLDLLPLGMPTARSLGVNVGISRLLLLVLVALLTAGATLVVGPLSFIGLLAPNLVRIMGLARARHQLAGAAVLGALVMVMADWIGRMLLFPSEIPAGIVATLIGGSYFMWRLRRL